MGLFHFVASAGRVLGGGRRHQHAGEAAPAAPSGNAILREFRKIGLAQLGGLNVTVQGRTATVTGRVPDAETREKAILVAGNIAGIEAVQADISTPEKTSSPTFHTVKEGETLAAIAERHDGVEHDELLHANKPLIDAPDEIYAGQVIRIPDKS
ncbi:LysM peptidoglycan-binding domain-containing protein [Rhizosaccharibacter radicis]|uniref:LysM peptidoglycan-binding domain-containing protein n=1 Tax=Rhizosaccharibacter radicis TaxID=2782605 RepID=A0ABT1VYP4_9PROT|nr:LysM peptidoglycan-binding domain-containing protein [Acetobacteraceae bacterium KSS12]